MYFGRAYFFSLVGCFFLCIPKHLAVPLNGIFLWVGVSFVIAGWHQFVLGLRERSYKRKIRQAPEPPIMKGKE